MGRFSVQRVHRSVAKGRLGEPPMGLRRGGETHRLYCSLLKEERLDFLQKVGTKAIQRVGYDRRIALLRDSTSVSSDFGLIDDFLLSSQESGTMWIVGQIFGPRLSEVWEQASQTLGVNADAPTVKHLEEMCEVLMEEFSPQEVRLFLAAAWEVKMRCHRELVALSEADNPWANFLLNTRGDDTAPTIPLPSEVDESIKVKRRERRQAEKIQRSEQRQQRDRSEQGSRKFRQRAKNGNQQTQPEGVPKELGFDRVPVEIARMVHPHLNKMASNVSEEPVGCVGKAYIRWGPKEGQGKARPVLVIASNRRRVWVRPIFTNDYKAGLWRSVIIKDWEKAGLDRQSHVSINVIELSISLCRVGKAKLSLADWNRVCQGEVHE